MSAIEHDHMQIGAYVLGALDREETIAFEAHLETCVECRREVEELSELHADLGEVPPEAFLEGPPESGDLLLQRTLRAVRAEDSARVEKSSFRPRLVAIAGVAAVLLIAVLLGAGVVIGRQTVTPVAAPAPTISSPAPGVRNLAATDSVTGATLSVAITPSAGWVRLHADVQGVAEGEKCVLEVVTKQGKSAQAGSWVVSAKGEHDGVGLDGSAWFPAEDIATIQVVTMDGRKLVSAQV